MAIARDPGFKDMWLRGIKSKYIAKEFNCSEGYVRSVARILGLPSRNHGLGDLFDEDIKRLSLEGFTIMQMEDELGVGHKFIVKRRKILGLSKGTIGR